MTHLKQLYGESLLTTVINSQRKVVQSRIKGRLPKFVFLCGKDINEDNGGNRKTIKNFYAKVRKDIMCIDVEIIWQKIFLEPSIDMLTFEEFVAEFCDAIILFVESFGTACELGAFSLKDNLISKMLVVIGQQYKDAESFINGGPLRKIKSLREENILYTDLNAILANETHYDVFSKFVPIEKVCRINTESNSVHINSFTIELWELIYLFGPITSAELIELYKFIKGFESFSLYYGLELGKAHRLIKHTHILSLLEILGLIISEDGYYSAKMEHGFSGFMFDLDQNKRNVLRTKILARKFRRRSGVSA